MNHYDYAIYVLEHNPIRASEVLMYRGLSERKPHGISQHIWKLAFLWVEQRNCIMYKRSPHEPTTVHPTFPRRSKPVSQKSF